MRGRAIRWFLVASFLGFFCLASSTAYLSADEPDSGLQKARRSFDQPDLSAVTFRAMNLLFPYRDVKAGQTTWELKRAPKTLDVTYEHEGKTRSLDDFLEKNYTNALLVIHEGRIVYETYRNGADENSRFISFSTGKSVTSTLVGAAVEDGFIKSVNDPLVSKNTNELKTRARRDVSDRRGNAWFANRS